MPEHNLTRWMTSVLCATIALGALSACAPLILGGAAVGTVIATDRRTTGMQVEDRAINLKADQRIKAALDKRGHININSYNRTVLLTGEVPTQEDRALAQKEVAAVENVKNVINELAVLGSSSLSSRSSDVVIASKVRATLIDAKNLHSNAFDVVVERGIVYLMGMVTANEAQQAIELTRSVRGVQKVINITTLLTQDQLRQQ